MRRIFLDANIFFASVKSQTGGSYFILELAKKGLVEIVTVAYALAEAERNIGSKLGEKFLEKHYDNLLAIKPQAQSIAFLPTSLEQRLAFAVPDKDIPIVAGAILSKADVLVTLDQKHLLKNEKLRKLGFFLHILTPGDFLKQFFKKSACPPPANN